MLSSRNNTIIFSRLYVLVSWCIDVLLCDKSLQNKRIRCPFYIYCFILGISSNILVDRDSVFEIIGLTEIQL